MEERKGKNMYIMPSFYQVIIKLEELWNNKLVKANSQKPGND